MCNRSGGNSSSWIYRGGNICSDLWELPATSFPEPWPSKIQKQPTSIASRSNRSNSLHYWLRKSNPILMQDIWKLFPFKINCWCFFFLLHLPKRLKLMILHPILDYRPENCSSAVCVVCHFHRPLHHNNYNATRFVIFLFLLCVSLIGSLL